MGHQYPVNEGLQHISNDHDISGLQHDDRARFQRDGVQSYDKQTYGQSVGESQYFDAGTGGIPRHGPQERRICGLSKKLFIIVFIVLLVVVLGAIGGGIGGAMAAKNSSKYEK